MSQFRFLGFNPGLLGDIVMGTTAATILKDLYPASQITCCISNDYHQIAPLLLNSPCFDRLYITHKPKDGFDEVDGKWFYNQHFHKVFDPMQDHLDTWWQHRIQPLEVAHMHGLPTKGYSGKVVLTKWFRETEGLKGYVAYAPFPAWYAGLDNEKAFTVERAQAIVDFILANGYKVLQVGHPDEPQLVGAEKRNTDYFTSVRNVMGCRFMLMGDSGMNWVLSAYDFPVLACYGHRYYSKEFVKNIQPLNRNAFYLDAPTVNEISLDAIQSSIRTMLSA